MNFKNLLFALAFIISSVVVAEATDAFEDQKQELYERISQMVQRACEQKQLLKVVAQNSSKDELAEAIWNLLEQNKLLQAKLARFK